MRSCGVTRRRAGRRRNATSPSASASTPPTPSITHGPNCGSRTRPAISSRFPRTIGATSSSTAPSSGRAAASSSRRGRGTASPSREPEADETPLGLVRDRVAAQLHDDRDNRSRRRPRRLPRRRRLCARRARARRTRAAAAFDAASERVGTAARVPNATNLRGSARVVRSHPRGSNSWSRTSRPSRTRRGARASAACPSRCAGSSSRSS